MHTIRNLVAALLTTVLFAGNASAFSLLGPFKGWMTADLGYTWNVQIGGPVLPSEAFRWNVPLIYYAVDRSFVEYFGPEGVAAVDAAIKVINDLPDPDQMSSDLREFPLNTRKINYSAQTMGLFDLKSRILGALLEQLGLTSPEQFVWTLRARDVVANTTNYSVVKLNYDPVTIRPSSYVNGALYTYEVIDQQLTGGGSASLAAEIKISDLRTRGYTSVAGSIAAGLDPAYSSVQDPVTGFTRSADGNLAAGDYFIGLTRDDVGGLRRIYNRNAMAVEDLNTDVLPTGATGSGGPWGSGSGVALTNVLSTNAVLPAIRRGIGAVRFQRVTYDSLIGQAFTPFNVTYTDQYISQGTFQTRSVTRRITRPDILFTARDLGGVRGTSSQFVRTPASDWRSNTGLNTHDAGFTVAVPGAGGGQITITPDVGPGVIQAPTGFSINISLTSSYPAYYNFAPGFVDELAAGTPIAWASFDGSTNAPVIYPRFGGVTPALLSQLVAGIGGSGGPSPWESSISFAFATNAGAQVTAGTTP
ncbi:MAG: hypothetical protein FJ405_11230 [Verrucomicrobia bacterium]|nr:hypothetical protein [Verrucomicrobiota bacterium]